MRLGPAGAERPVIRDEAGVLYELSGLTADIDGAFLAAGGLDAAARAIAAGELPVLNDPGDGSGLRLGAPIARPSAVICVGMNYAAHAAESGAAPPTKTGVFFKHPNTVVGPFDDVLLPPGSAKTDWEVELGVVIGKRARYLSSPSEALAHVAGYTVSNDVSEREFQIELSGGQWSKGKSSETFNPLGPWLVRADQVGDGSGISLRSFVNGEPRQDSPTADMIFDVAQLVYDLSQYLVLEPGDLLNSGTPQGVALGGKFPYLVADDVMELEIEGLGRQRQNLVQARP